MSTLLVMTNSDRDAAAVAAIARAIHRAWPARTMVKFAAGWSQLFLVALRADPQGRGAIAAARRDEETLAQALAAPGVLEPPVDNAHRLAREILAALSDSTKLPG
jgi:tRNA U34 5-methylaminomethyl-2-thiouridine-forming methyltransferase MnmC